MTITTPESVFTGNHFRIRGEWLTVTWFEYYIEDRSGIQLGFARRKPRHLFNLKVGARVYSDETMSTELFSVKQRAAWVWTPNYDVVDTTTGQTIGVIRRNGFGSFASKEWFLVDALGRELGTVERHSSQRLFSMQHRFSFVFGTHNIEIADERLKPLRRMSSISLNLSTVPVEALDRRLAIAFGLIVLATDTLS